MFTCNTGEMVLQLSSFQAPFAKLWRGAQKDDKHMEKTFRCTPEKDFRIGALPQVPRAQKVHFREFVAILGSP